ncbi:MAG: hypothetical protein PHI37_00575 [Candidatus Gracilibacteria bacterium]|nr:hypothetical protein [Candidatus Gracilibacteria bacterium]
MYTREFFINLEKELNGNSLAKNALIQINVSNNNIIFVKLSDYNKYGVGIIDCFSGLLENIGVVNTMYEIDEKDILNYEDIILNNKNY